MPSLADLQNIANPAVQDPNTGALIPGVAGTAVTQGSSSPGANATLPAMTPDGSVQATAVPPAANTGAGSILDNLKTAFDPSNILGTVTPLATGLIGLLGNQQSTDALQSGTADAMKTITDGNQKIQDLLKSIYGDQSALLQPYQAAGQQGLNGLVAGTAPGGDLVQGYQGPTQFNRDPNFTGNPDFKYTAQDFAADPGTQFRIDEQNKLLARRQASQGSLSSGAALKASTAYAGNLADQEYVTAYNRAENTFGQNYNRDSSQFSDNFSRDQGEFSGNFSRGLAEQQSNQQQKMSALMNLAGIGQSATNTLVSAKGQQGQESAQTQQLTDGQVADLQTSLASAIAAGDTARANQISGIISGTLGAAQSAADAARALANKTPPSTTTVTNNIAGGQGGTGGQGGVGQGGNATGGTGGTVGDVTQTTGPVTQDQNTTGGAVQTYPAPKGAIQSTPAGSIGGNVQSGIQTAANGLGAVQTLKNLATGAGDIAGAVQTAPDLVKAGSLAAGALSSGEVAAGALGSGAAATAGMTPALAAAGWTTDGMAAGGTAAGTGGGTMAAISGFLTNPITIGVGAALVGAYLWKKSQVHPTATTFVNDFQQPFGEHLGNVVDGFDKALASGSLDKATAQQLYTQTKGFIDGFTADTAKFSAEGGKQATVAQQAQDTMTKDFGPNYEKILGKMQTEIAGLPDAPPSAGIQRQQGAPATGVQNLQAMAGVA